MNLKCFISQLENGVATARPMMTGNIAPRLAKVMMLILERPSLKPKGMANFSSTKGVMAAKNTFSSSFIVFLYSS